MGIPLCIRQSITSTMKKERKNNYKQASSSPCHKHQNQTHCERRCQAPDGLRVRHKARHTSLGKDCRCRTIDTSSRIEYGYEMRPCTMIQTMTAVHKTSFVSLRSCRNALASLLSTATSTSGPYFCALRQKATENHCLEHLELGMHGRVVNGMATEHIALG
jgi:hypothetical protein